MSSPTSQAQTVRYSKAVCPERVGWMGMAGWSSEFVLANTRRDHEAKVAERIGMHPVGLDSWAE